MLPDYADIRALTDREPDWYDEQGVPRYAPFEPRMLGVYDYYAVLVLIACQSCGKRFEVGLGRPKYEFDAFDRVVRHNLRRMTEGFHYGDPPRHDCCGDTMNCEDLSVLESWWRSNYEWKRDGRFEGLLP